MFQGNFHIDKLMFWEKQNLVYFSRVLLMAVGLAVGCFCSAVVLGSCSTPLQEPSSLAARSNQDSATKEQNSLLTPSRNASDVSQTALDAASGTADINLFTSEGSLRNIDWSEVPEITAALQAFSDAGYETGFVVYDFTTGKGIGRNADEAFFSASTIKAPYVAYIAQSLIDEQWATLSDEVYESMTMEGTGIMADDDQDVYDLQGVLYNTIVHSDNTGYALLRENYNGDFEDWSANIGVDAYAWQGEWFPYYSPRDLAKLWLGVGKYLSSSSGSAPLCDKLFTQTENSFIRKTLGADRRVLSKPGYEITADDIATGALNDAGIVRGSAGDYVIAVMSNADYDDGYHTETEVLITDLIKALDITHARLLAGSVSAAV